MIKKIIKCVRKFFWVEPSQAKKLERTAKKEGISESAFMRKNFHKLFE